RVLFRSLVAVGAAVAIAEVAVEAVAAGELSIEGAATLNLLEDEVEASTIADGAVKASMMDSTAVLQFARQAATQKLTSNVAASSKAAEGTQPPPPKLDECVLASATPILIRSPYPKVNVTSANLRNNQTVS